MAKKTHYSTEILSDNGYIENDGYTSFKLRVVGACPIYLGNFLIDNTDGIQEFRNPIETNIETRLQVRFAERSAEDKEVHILKTYYR